VSAWDAIQNRALEWSRAPKRDASQFRRSSIQICAAQASLRHASHVLGSRATVAFMMTAML
jgi:hypothetical protein